MDIAVDKVRTLILEARRVDVKEGATDTGSGSNATDDGEIDVLAESGMQDGVESEFRGLIEGMNDDERANVIALVLVGRGDFDAKAEWDDAVALGRERDGEGRPAEWLLGIPNLPDLLEEALAAKGVSMMDEDARADDADSEAADDEVEIIRHGHE